MDQLIVHTHMNDGTPILLRTITREDGDLLRDGISKLSSESRYFRFFSPSPIVPSAVVEKLLDVDGVNHIAWGALCTTNDGPYPIGAVHAVRGGATCRTGEYSVAILDQFHGQGVARMLTAALLSDCIANGIAELDVHILSDNRAATTLVRSMGAKHRNTDSGVNSYVLNTTIALNALQKDTAAQGLKQVFHQLAQP